MKKKVNLVVLFSPLMISTSIINFNNTNLDKIAIGKTDKSSEFHFYTHIYDSYLSRVKGSEITFLEIGFATGGSAQMWDTYFTNPNTELYFIDIDEKCFNHTEKLSKRCSLYMANQEKKDELISTISIINKKFDIIIDDGGHTMNQQRVSFETLFPFVKPGGVYIVEDLQTSYLKLYGGNGDFDNPLAGPQTMIRFLASLIDEVNYLGGRTGLGDPRNRKNMVSELNYYQNHIKSIHFYNNLCFVFKH